MKCEIDDKFGELNRRVKLTSKARYNAGRRLLFQNSLSQVTLALLSVALIIIPLITVYGISVTFSEGYIGIMQVIFAVLVLTYSLLLATGNYSARAVKVHRCGMELGRIARKIKPYIGIKNHEEKYIELTNDYYNCLEKYENHINVDFLIADYSSTDWENRYSECGTKSCVAFLLLHKMTKRISFFWQSFYPVSHYFVSIFGVYLWLYLMVSGGSANA